MSKPKKDWTIKKIIKKATDVNLNTALALSRSLLDEQKIKKRRAKEAEEIPFHLMWEPDRVKDILDERLSEYVLEPLHFQQYDTRDHKFTKNWDKSSLYNDIMPGDLSYDNINLSEQMEYYVAALMPSISISTVRVGDKIFSMSQIPGRENSIIMSATQEDIVVEVEAKVCKNIESEVDSWHNEEVAWRPEKDVSDNIRVEDDHSHLVIEEAPHIEEIDVKISTGVTNRFMDMFNNYKYSDLFILLKSGGVLNLHKFVLAAWHCDDDAIKENEYFVASIDDDIVIRIFKHLYSDGTFPIDDIIDTDDCIALCKKFGINHKLLKKCPPIHPIVLPSPPLTATTHYRSPINLKYSNYEIFHSTPYCLQSGNNTVFIDGVITSPILSRKDLSDSDLFQSFSQEISISIDQTHLSSREDKEERKIFKEAPIFVEGLKEEEKKESNITEIIDLSSPMFNERKANLENETIKTNIEEELNDLSFLAFEDGSKSNLENGIITTNIEEELNDLSFPTFDGSNANNENEMIKTNIEIERNNLSFLAFEEDSKPNLENGINMTNNFEELNNLSFPIFEEKPNGDKDKSDEEELLNLSLDLPQTNNSKHSLNYDFFDSPLPLSQRLNLHMGYDAYYRESQRKSPIMSPLTITQRMANNLHNIARPSTSTTLDFSSDDDARKITKKPVKRRSSGTIDKNGAVKKKRIPKSQMKFETPKGKGKPEINPFTPMPDFATMVTPEMQKQRLQYGLKNQLSKKQAIIVLQECHRLTHQIDNDSMTSSSTDEENSVIITQAVPVIKTTVTDAVDENEFLYQFLKVNYFFDILTFKALDANKIISELKALGMMPSVKKLFDYFDEQCISYIRHKDNDIGNMRFKVKANKKKFVI